MPSASRNPNNPSSLRAVGLWFADKAGTAAIGLLVVAGLTGLGFLLFGGSDRHDDPPPALSTQWLHERAAIARKGWRIAQTRQVDLRGIGEPSTIFVLSPPAKSCTDPTSTRSQQIRIYDVNEGQLDRALAFEPKKLGGCPPMNFEFVRVAPLREYSDAPLILGRFVGGIKGFFDEISIPIVIAWDDRSQQYTLRPLLIQSPRLVEFIYGNGEPLSGTDRLWYRQAKQVFEHPVDLGSGIGGYAVSAFAFGRSYWVTASPIIAGVYRLSAGNAGKGNRMIGSPVVYQQALWALETTPEGALYAGECSLTGGRMTQGLASESSLATRLVKRADTLISGCAEY